MIRNSSYLCNVKKRIFIFILFVIGLVAFTVKLVDITSADVDTSCFNRNELEISSVHEYSSSINQDDTFRTPVSAILFAHCSNIHSGYVRTTNRCMRSIYRYCPNTFLKDGKVIDFAVTHNFPRNRNLFYTVKQSLGHGFIRLCKLLI